MPADHVGFTAFAGLLGRTLPPEALADALRAQLESWAGDPAAVGGLTPAHDLLAAGLSQSQHYLPHVAEGRIDARPGIAGVEGDVVRFTDGTEATVDAVVLATGFASELPYLAAQPEALDAMTFDAARPGARARRPVRRARPRVPGPRSCRRGSSRRSGRASGASSARRSCPTCRTTRTTCSPRPWPARSARSPTRTRIPALVEALRFGPMLGERYRLGEPGMAERFAAHDRGIPRAGRPGRGCGRLAAPEVVASVA